MYPVLFFVVQPVFLSIIILGLILSILSGLAATPDHEGMQMEPGVEVSFSLKIGLTRL